MFLTLGVSEHHQPRSNVGYPAANGSAAFGWFRVCRPALQLGRRQFVTGRYQYRSLQSRWRKPPRPPVLFFKARCVTGWFVWQSDWQSAPKGTAKFLAIWWCLLAGVYRFRLRALPSRMTLFAQGHLAALYLSESDTT